MATKFDAAFLNRKMAERKRWQHDVEKELLDEVLEEMAEALQMPAFAKRADAPVLPFPEVGKGPAHIVRIR